MDNIKDKLARIGALAGSGDELERDLVLELLREVYVEVKFGDSKGNPEEFGPRREENPVDEILPSALADGEPEPAVISDPVAIVDAPGENEPVAVEEEEPAAAIDEDEDEPAAEEEEATAMEEEPAPEIEEPPIVPRRVAPEVIRSLYGDEPETEEAGSPTGDAAPAQTVVAAKINEDPLQKMTLGDAMATGHKTLGETLRNGDHDMASKIAAAERPGLRRSIGLNDRFLMIRDMFDGDAAAFDSAITQLDAFTDLDEAVIWIHDNFDWSAENRGVTLLVGLLERKLGH